MNFRFSGRLLASAAALVMTLPAAAQQAPIDLKKWPKNDPMDYVLLKDERALYKRLTTDEERSKFIAFSYARRSTKEKDFKVVIQLLAGACSVYEVTHEDNNTKQKRIDVPALQTDPCRFIISQGLPDHAEESKEKAATYVLHYNREIAPGSAHPRVFELKRQEMRITPDNLSKVLRYPASFPPTMWEGLLPPADADWASYQADPESVLLKQCIPLLPGLCAPPAPAPNPGGDAAAPATPEGEGTLQAGKLSDPEFAASYPGNGTIEASLNANFLPTQVAGDTEIRIVIASSGGAMTAVAHLIPLEGSGGDEQDFKEADFKGLTLKGKYYLEARRSVKAGRYRLAAVAKRGTDFARMTQTIPVPTFNPGTLTIATGLIAESAESAPDGDPLTIGRTRIIPAAGRAFRAGETYSAFFVVYGPKSTAGYGYRAVITCRLVAGAARAGDEKKLSFKNGNNILERECGSLNSASPLLGGEFEIPGPPPAATVVTAGKSEQVPLRWTEFKIRAKIEDVNMPGQSVTSPWYAIPLAK